MSAPSIFNALDPQASAWVGANAGAGKTYILVSRLARLMLDGVAPEQILCLTYTRAAAAEMQLRLFDLLAEWALLDDAKLRDEIETRLGCSADAKVLQRARILFARALETPGGLRVQTIHGFCESLLKRFPLEAGLSPHFDLLDEQEARSLQSALIADLLADGQAPALAAAMARLTRALSEPDILALGRQIIDRRAIFEQAENEERLEQLARAMQLNWPVIPAETQIAAFFEQAIAVLKPMPDWLLAGGVNDKRQAARLQNALAQIANAPMAAWSNLASVFFTQSGQPRAQLASNGRANDNPDLFETLSALAVQVAALNDKLKALVNWQLTEAVYVFADALLSAYQRAKTGRAVLDYEDMIAVTGRLLQGPNAVQWVLYKIDSGLHHILIDEAQDTSPAQWQIISALAEGFFDDVGLSGEQAARTIFAVGDEKQSIFSFQGADPTGFDAQRAHFHRAVEAIGGQFHQLPMRLSRRSAGQILQAVDWVFADSAEGVTANGDPLVHEAHRTEAVGHVEIWPPCIGAAPEKTDEAWQIPQDLAVTGRAQLAGQIADKIAAMLRDKNQNVRPADILVLVRSRDAFVGTLTGALKRRNIAVAGSDRMVLLEQIAIADMLAAMDFALNPLDDMALAIYLRSPLGGFSENHLFELAHGRTGSLWQALTRASDPMAKAAHERLSWLRDRVDYLSPYEVFAQFLGAQGGHKLLSARLGDEIDDPLNELLQLALAFERRQPASMQGFLHWLRQGSQEIKRDMEAGGGAVRIMTVHGAKGLEAPIVFLPDTCRPAKKRGGGRERMQFDAAKRPLWRANQALRDPYNAAQAAAHETAQAQEEKRLLYVAMTRARERLYIGGWLAAGESTAPEGSWYAMIDAALDENKRMALAGGEHKLPRENEVQEQPDVSGAALKSADMPPAWLMQNPTAVAHGAAYIGMKVFAPSALGEQEGETGIEGDAETGVEIGSDADMAARAKAIERGQIIHKLLELLPTLEASQRADAALAYAQRRADVLDEAASQAAAREALQLISAPSLSALFSPNGRAEVPIAGALTLPQGGVVNLAGQIDRMVETDEMILLVDFKTGRPPQETAMSGAYVTQMAAYRGLMQAAKGPDKPVQCALIWTRNGRIDILSEAAMESALSKLSP